MEVCMQVSKWGNSLAVRLPKKLVEQMGLVEGDEIKVVDVVEKTLLIKKDDRREAALAALASLNLPLPPDYKFNREEANER
jgi:antitoxin MazE